MEIKYSFKHMVETAGISLDNEIKRIESGEDCRETVGMMLIMKSFYRAAVHVIKKMENDEQLTDAEKEIAEYIMDEIDYENSFAEL